MLTDFGAAINNPAIRAQVTGGQPPALSNATQHFNPILQMLRTSLADFKLLKDATKQRIQNGTNGSGTWVRFAPTVTELIPLGDDPKNQNQKTGLGAIEYEVTTNNYGLHRVFADREHRLRHDPADIYRRELPVNHMETLEEIVRNHLIVHSDKVYASDKTTGFIPISVAEMTTDCTPDISELNAIAMTSLRPKLIPFFNNLGSKYRVLASLGVREEFNSDPLVIQQMDFDQTARFITTPQNEIGIQLLHVHISEYIKAYVSQPGAPDLNGDLAIAGLHAHHTLVYGRECFGIGFMKNMGTVIVKKANKSNIIDPLNRIRETQGWKVDDFGVAVITKVFDYISTPTLATSYQLNTDQTMQAERLVSQGTPGETPEIGGVLQPDL